jgi:hypothetical protein
VTASSEAATPALQGVQRLSPNDPRNGSMRRALTALLESWVNDSRDSALPRGSAIATPNRRPAKDGMPAVDPSVARLAAALEAIAAMDALPLVPSPPLRKKEAPVRDLNDHVRKALE